MNRSSTILIVDDDSELRWTTNRLLTNNGFVVAEAATCRSATEQLKQCTFDLVLLDINLKGESGIGVLSFICENHLTSKVIMLTGERGLDVAINAMTHGAMDYIPKPYRPEYLIERIESMLGKPA